MQNEKNATQINRNGTVTYQNIHSTRRVCKMKLSLKRVALVMGVAGVSFVGIKEIRYQNTHKNVEHMGTQDYYTVDGKLQHSHELDKKTFVEDYLIVNPMATEEDVLDAIYQGEYENYLDDNGMIKIEKDLQGDQTKENKEIIQYAEQFIENHGGKSMK